MIEGVVRDEMASGKKEPKAWESAGTKKGNREEIYVGLRTTELLEALRQGTNAPKAMRMIEETEGRRPMVEGIDASRETESSERVEERNEQKNVGSLAGLALLLFATGGTTSALTSGGMTAAHWVNAALLALAGAVVAARSRRSGEGVQKEATFFCREKLTRQKKALYNISIR